MQREYNYEDVYLVPQKCIVDSRSECNISVDFGGRLFRNPVIAANMMSVVNYNTCEYLASKGMFYIMHRFGLDLEEYITFLRKMAASYYTSISIGVKENDRELIKTIKSNGIELDYITIDIANAYNNSAIEMCKFIRSIYPYFSTYIIVGNVCTPEAVEFLCEEGLVDMIKVGISCGSVCSTKNATGFNRRMVSAMIDCGKVSKVPLIADGSLKEIGHIAIALNTSKHCKFVMSGNMFAGFEQSNGDILHINNQAFKEYYGNASEKTKGYTKHVEGFCQLIPYKGDMGFFIEQMEDGLRSAVSYGGVSDINDFYGVPMIYHN